MNPASFRLTAVLAALLANVPAAHGADHFPAYFGRWTITEARPAPWIDSPAPPTTSAELGLAADGLVGKTVTYTPDRIFAPRPLRCGRPDYAFVDVPPEGLFQGKLTRPADQARALGFPAGTVRTLQTGCASLIDFHFTDEGAALFALDDRIYSLKKDDAARAR